MPFPTPLTAPPTHSPYSSFTTTPRHSPHPGSQTSGPSWNVAPERAALSPPGGDRTRRNEGGRRRDGWEGQGTGPHPQEQLPALGIIVLLGENLAEAGEDPEAVPGGGGQQVEDQRSAPSPALSPAQGPSLPTWLLPPRLPEACGWGWTAGPTPRHKRKRSF